MNSDFSKVFSEWEKTHKIINKDDEIFNNDTLGIKKNNKDLELSIDLHNLTKKEAIDKLRLFVINNQSSFLQKIKIIHGRGNHSKEKSVLKIAVNEWLKNNSKLVKNFRPGKIGEGSFGVTIAYIIPK